MALTDKPLYDKEITLAGKRYHTLGPVQKRRASQWSPAQRTGDPQLTDQQLASEVVWRDQTGGAGVRDMDEREFPDHYDDSSLHTLGKSWLTLPPAKILHTMQTGSFSDYTFGSVLNIESSTSYVYLAGGTTVRRFLRGESPTASEVRYYDNNTGVGGAWSTTGGTVYALSDSIQSDPVVWKGNVWLPIKTKLTRYNVSGVRFDNVTDGGADILAKFVLIFDEDLVVITTAGAIKSTDDNSLTPTWVSRGAIDSFSTINSAIVHRNSAGEPAIWISTDRGLYVLDYWSQKVYTSGIQFAGGGESDGLSMASWDGDLWYSRGGEVYQVLNGVQVRRELDFRNGSRKFRAGTVTRLIGGLDHSLLAVVDGRGLSFSSINAYNRKGWHTIVHQHGDDGAGGSYVAPLIDGFNRANSTGFGTSDSGHTWTMNQWGGATSTVWKIVGKRASIDSVDMVVGATYAAYITSFYANVSVRAAWPRGTKGLTGFLVRYLNSSNHLIVRTTTSGAAIELVTVVSGVETVLGTYTPTPSSSTIPEPNDVLSVVAHSTSVRVYLNGREIISATDSNHSINTSHGLYRKEGASGIALLDDVLIARGGRIAWSHVLPPRYQYDDTVVLYNHGTELYAVWMSDRWDDANQLSSGKFATSGYHITPWFDAGLSTVQKTALSVDVRVLDASANETVTVLYGLDDDESWTQLKDSAGVNAEITASGSTILYLDSDRLGTKYRTIRFKVRLKGQFVEESNATFIDYAQGTPKLVYLKLRYLRELPILYGWEVHLDLSRPTPDNRMPDKAVEDLETLLENRLLVNFAYQSGQTADTKAVFILSYSGPHNLGTDKTATATVTLIEVDPDL